jgi:hypothetical protein
MGFLAQKESATGSPDGRVVGSATWQEVQQVSEDDGNHNTINPTSAVLEKKIGPFSLIKETNRGGPFFDRSRRSRFVLDLLPNVARRTKRGRLDGPWLNPLRLKSPLAPAPDDNLVQSPSSPLLS